MKCKVTLAGMALLAASNGWAAAVPYYNIEEISVSAEGAEYGAYPSAMAISDNGDTFIGTYSMKASLSQDIDLGLPFTFNRACQYDDEICELEFYGSQTSGDLSYDNAYQAWRNAQYDAQNGGYSSYMMGNAFTTSDDEDSVDGIITITSTDAMLLPFDLGNYDTDVKVTDVFVSDAGDNIVIGYSSAPYDGSTERDFVRRGFIYNQTQNVLNSLLPDFDTNGGFSSAYKIKQVGSKILVVGASSISFPEDDDDDDVQDYFNYCYGLDDYDEDEISTLNNLVYCPGFDTQAWAWDVTDYLTSTVTAGISGSALATEWLDDNATNASSDITYSAGALDINASGIAVGVSTFEYSDVATGGRQRAIIMTQDYNEPTELSKAVDDVEDDEGETIYNSWATTITDTNIVIGNREYSASKNSNKPTEFFVYDIDNDSISFPLKDKKVLSTEQRLNGDSSAYTGANSRAYDINESGFIVGKADDYDQTNSVNGGSPRSQSAFLYDNDLEKSWFINDLICSEDDSGVVTTPLYKIRSARVINDNGTVLAEGRKYGSDSDYTNESDGTEVMLKLTRNTDVVSPDDSPNCWDSALLANADSDYERSGAATFWLWLFALPLLLVRRLIK
ncbi:DUF3466 family protein [Psychromonas sp.]|uniref:DUF3466 family protein n=1 Tax=Psychromonas sp. TaxID=1884585 RepID=UPI0035697575